MVDPPRLVKLCGDFNIVHYDARYYRVPQTMGGVRVDRMTPEQEAKVGIFTQFRDALSGHTPVHIRGAVLLEANRRREAEGRTRVSRGAVEAALYGRDDPSDDEVMAFILGMGVDKECAA